MKKGLLVLLLISLYSLSAFSQCSTTADFNYAYVDCNRIQFTDFSTTASANYRLVKWQWNFGDGDTATGQVVTHTFTPGVNVQVKLVVTAEDTLGNTCQDSVTKSISIRTLPDVYIASDPNPTCLNVAPLFRGSSNHGIKSWQWIFGDGDTANVQNPIHQYVDTGSYNVILHVIDSSGCANQNSTVYIQRVDPIPTVDFTWSPDPAATVDNIQFSGTSNSTNVTSWHWDFGTGDTANVQNPTYSYSTTGKDTVTLSIVANGVCSTSIKKVVSIDPLPAPDFSYSTACLNDKIYFSDSTTTPVGTIQTWKWYFGDGDSTIVHSPDNPNVSHTYVTQNTYKVTLLAINSDGYQRSITKSITVAPKPTADFYVNDTCYRNPTTFRDQSSLNGGSPIVSWHWTFGDGNTSNAQDTLHTYSYPGTYAVHLYIENGDGCRDTAVQNVVMDTLPAVAFTMSQDTICLGDPITFSGQSSQTVSWHWDFGNGDTSSYQTTTYQFPTSGLKTVTLLVTNTKGCSSSITHSVYVKPVPNPNFDFTILCHHDTTCFNDLSSGYIVDWQWSFGDGATSNIQNPVHYYQPVRNYNAQLTVTSNENCSSSVTRLIIFDSVQQSHFTVSNACTFDRTVFTDSTTTPGSSTIDWRKWYFGDGDSLVVTDPAVTTAEHIYLGTTTYNVTLITHNTFGKYDTITRLISVHRKPKAEFIVNDTCYNEPLTFTDQSMKDGGSDLSAWNWNFGDSISGTRNESTLQNPTHTMSYPGSYDVRLIVSNTDNCSDTVVHNVVVDSLPNVDFTIQQDTLCYGDDARFYGSGKDITSWHWDFGNGDTSSYQNPVYQYPAPGNYTVTLVVTDLKGCSNSVSHTIFVADTPKADFSFGPSCSTDSVSFSDETVAPDGYVTNWQWNFDDTASTANGSVEENPAHLFTAVGTYHVQLTVVTNYGCTDTVAQFVNVYESPKAAFSYHQVCDPATQVDFTDQSVRSSSNSPISSYLWNFYQADTSSLKDPTYRFPHYDSCYQVRLTVTDTNGCQNTDTVQVCLRDSLTVDFNMPEVCLGQRTLFQSRYNPSNDSIASYTWNFGDGSTEAVTYHDTISHVFPRPGTYNVTLSALDTNGCSVSISHVAVVDSLPQPDFTYVTPSCDEPTYFQGSTRGGGNFISHWNWHFGDVSSGTADTSSLQNPNHLYVSNDSSYQVKLIVTNFNGCIDSITKPVVRNSCMEVYYTVNTSTGCADNPIYFYDRTFLSSTKGSITRWTWNFGDGDSLSYTAHRDSVLHFYAAAGSYHVTLTVYASVNNMPFSNTYDSTLQVYRPPLADFGVSNACTSQTVYFTDSTQIFDAGLNTWQWTFNDPYSAHNTSGEQNPQHIYDSTGSFPAQLVVTDYNNCRDTATKTVEVHPTPLAAFNLHENYNGTTGQVFLENTSLGASTYFWELGDGNTSTDESPVYRYTSVDIFHILLTATSEYLCSDTASAVYDLTSGLFVPNSFAPESDKPGVKAFKPVGIHLKEYEVQVFSSWGNLLWESNKLNANGEPVDGWDGTYKGQPMPAGIYIWKIKAKFLDDSVWKGSDNGDGNTKPYGTVLLIR